MKSAAVKISVSLLLSAFCLYLATRNVHLGELVNTLSRAALLPLLAAACVSFVTFCLRGFRWRILLAPFQEISVAKLVRWQVGGLLINNLMPLRLGELARAYWAGHKTAVSKTTILATIVIERVLDVLSIFCIGLTLVLYSGFYRLQAGGGSGRLWIGGGALAFLAACAVILVKNRAHHAVLDKILARLPEKAATLARHFLDGFKVIKNVKEALGLFLLSVTIWSVDILALAIISRSLNLNLTWMQAGLTIVGLTLGVMIPAAPGAAGTYEAGGVTALTWMGFDKTLALSYILLVHGLQYVLVLAAGVPILALEGFGPTSLRDLKGEEA